MKRITSISFFILLMAWLMPFNANAANTMGDVNGDRKINVRDRICLARHLAKWSGYGTVGKEAADVNADGVVNAKDRVVLTRYLAKWSGYSKLPCKK